MLFIRAGVDSNRCAEKFSTALTPNGFIQTPHRSGVTNTLEGAILKPLLKINRRTNDVHFGTIATKQYGLNLIKLLLKEKKKFDLYTGNWRYDDDMLTGRYNVNVVHLTVTCMFLATGQIVSSF